MWLEDGRGRMFVSRQGEMPLTSLGGACPCRICLLHGMFRAVVRGFSLLCPRSKIGGRFIRNERIALRGSLPVPPVMALKRRSKLKPRMYGLGSVLPGQIEFLFVSGEGSDAKYSMPFVLPERPVLGAQGLELIRRSHVEEV